MFVEHKLLHKHSNRIIVRQEAGEEEVLVLPVEAEVLLIVFHIAFLLFVFGSCHPGHTLLPFLISIVYVKYCLHHSSQGFLHSYSFS